MVIWECRYLMTSEMGNEMEIIENNQGLGSSIMAEEGTLLITDGSNWLRLLRNEIVLGEHGIEEPVDVYLPKSLIAKALLANVINVASMSCCDGSWDVTL